MASDQDLQDGPGPVPGPGTPAWPGVAYEDVPWEVHPVSGMSRRDAWRIGSPYRASVPPAIARRDPAVSAGVAGLAEEAAVAVSAFDAEHGGEMTPYAAILLRSESVASSEIEGLTASARKVAEAEVNGSGTEHAMMIVGNVRAMSSALRLADALDVEAVLAMHRALMESSEPRIAGCWRTDQVWIGGRALMGAGSPHDADFVPPVAERVGALMDDLMEFATRDDLSSITQAAVAHAQLETIHPFEDGNGRTGRALLQAMLRAAGITRSVSVPISAGLLAAPDAYVDALTAYRRGEVDPIVECVARAALAGVDNGRALIADLREVRSRWDELLAGVRRDSRARDLADALFQQPVVTAPPRPRAAGDHRERAPSPPDPRGPGNS